MANPLTLLMPVAPDADPAKIGPALAKAHDDSSTRR